MVGSKGERPEERRSPGWRRFFGFDQEDEVVKMSEQERARMAAERSAAHLARAESELEAAQRFVDPGGGGETERALSRAIASARVCVQDAMETVRRTIEEQDIR